MNIKSVATSIGTFVVGVILIAMIVSFLLGMMLSPSRDVPRTIIVERPDHYRGWWGHYGAGLPGWGGRGGPPPPPPPSHPKPPAPPAPKS